MGRRHSREAIFKLTFNYLFQNKKYDFNKDEFEFLSGDKLYDKYIVDSYSSVIDNYESIMNMIKENLTRYKVERIYKIDLAILITAINEFIYAKTTSSAIAINEAVELAKKYSTEKSYIFINGVLATIVNNGNIEGNASGE